MSKDSKEAIGLLGREDSRRLIQHDDTSASVENLEDLDPLPLADGKAGDAGVGIHCKAALLHKLAQPHTRFAQMEGWSPERAGAKYDIFQNGEALSQRKVLMDHADACL